jgi:hypothetical protein
MKKTILFLAAAIILFLPGCEVVKGIFNLGMAVGILIVVAVIVIILWLIYSLRRNR